MDITPYKKNAKKHPKEQIARIARSIKEFGFNQPIVVDKQGVIIVGHGRYEAAKMLDMKDEDIPVTVVDLSEERANAYRLADNKLNESEWDMHLVIEELKGLSEEMIELTGFDIDLSLEYPNSGVKLADRFMLPPFSVLDARQGVWQDRKRAWVAMGIESELGRSEGLLGGGENSAMLSEINDGTSVFDPTLCELLYTWFVPPNGSILDPFAGGSVRGIVASKQGHPYTGIELRDEQVEANRAQANLICESIIPAWICGDSNTSIPQDGEYDFVFSCPPYADLEVYSDDPADLSNMPYDQFLAVYRSIINQSVAHLRDNRFACFVVGEVRDKKGIYRDFIGDTVQAFKDAGASYYNEAILVTAVGTLPLRAGRTFNASRKLGKTHQNILVFYKGDPKKIKEIYGEIDLSALDAVVPM